jgi:hypothetical protein
VKSMVGALGLSSFYGIGTLAVPAGFLTSPVWFQTIFRLNGEERLISGSSCHRAFYGDSR